MEASPAHSDATASTTTTTTVDASALGSSLDIGKMEYGCKHYRRRCKIRAPCCNEVFTCRHCHNESVADRHELPRHDVQRVICLVCDVEQPPAQVCSNCGVNMGEYFCDICKFYDDDTEKRQYHCNDCGICRVGGQENFFHCQKCGSCYSVHLRNKHQCVENSMRRHCPICYEYLFDSLKETRVLKCGHTMHWDCLNEMLKHDQYACPTCSKSVIDMSRIRKKLDEETEKRQYHCNDCGICRVGGRENFFHCQKCGNQNVQDEAHLGDAQGGLQREETTLESLSGEVNQIRTSLEALTLMVDSTHQSFLEYRQEFHQFEEALYAFQQILWDHLVAHCGAPSQ